MCNLYNITTTTEALRQFTKALRDRGGWNQPTLDIFPNVRAPVVRVAKDGQREITMLQWGMPTPPERVKGNYDPGTTNIRQPAYFHWRQWMGVENRCIVPATSFAEPSPRKDTNGKTPNVWFALGDDEPLFAFPGIWTRWQGVRRVRDGPGDFELFGIFTTRPNAVVAPIHDKAMPVILRSEEEIRGSPHRPTKPLSFKGRCPTRHSRSWRSPRKSETHRQFRSKRGRSRRNCLHSKPLFSRQVRLTTVHAFDTNTRSSRETVQLVRLGRSDTRANLIEMRSAAQRISWTCSLGRTVTSHRIRCTGRWSPTWLASQAHAIAPSKPTDKTSP